MMITSYRKGTPQTAAFRMLRNRVAADTTDEYICIGESIAIKSMRRLVTTVVEIFEPEYLISPNENDITRLLAIAEEIVRRD
jgi:hypothetical protein